ncbi:MAG: hypothetical protein CO163_07340 [Rhodobacterales bacterium CG_4_9_14_3_um_filter_71_31]|nr:MAG: hypothetical protein CO163_07340 [Rhodobacterales bacterium CG_4_9_14_3_um_filter_71_31]
MDGMNFAPTAPLRLAGARMAGFNPAAKLANLVESEVIPRLLLSRRANPADRRPSAAHVETLARLALSRDPGAAAAQVMSLRETGMPVEVLLNDLITPAARRIGVFWTIDSVDFVEVALAAGRLVAVVRALGAHGEAFAREAMIAAGAPCALMATVGAERHGLGALTAAQTLRCGGWRVREAPGVSANALVALASRAKFDVIGLSLGGDRNLDEIARLIARLRRVSRNRRAAIALGGPACLADPMLGARLGADFTATSGREALTRAQAHLNSVIESVK